MGIPELRASKTWPHPPLRRQQCARSAPTPCAPQHTTSRHPHNLLIRSLLRATGRGAQRRCVRRSSGEGSRPVGASWSPRWWEQAKLRYLRSQSPATRGHRGRLENARPDSGTPRRRGLDHSPPNITLLPRAQEAIFSILRILNSADERLRRQEGQPPSGPLDPGLLHTIIATYRRALANLAR